MYTIFQQAFIMIMPLMCALFSLIKIHSLWGSSHFFTLFNSQAPLLGHYVGTFSSGFILFFYSLFKIVIKGGSFYNPLVYHIPTMFAAASWGSYFYVVQIYVPFLCMIIFLMHPVGGQAWFYTLYWWIPIIITVFALDKKNVWFKALASTFVAHAVGSVLWLYAMPMQASYFALLMPIVFVERILFAAGMVIVKTCIDTTMQVWFSCAKKNSKVLFSLKG